MACAHPDNLPSTSRVSRNRTFRPSIWGKGATATYLLTSVVFMYFNYRRETSILIDVMVWLSLAMTLISSGDYFVRMRRLINEGH